MIQKRAEIGLPSDLGTSTDVKGITQMYEETTNGARANAPITETELKPRRRRRSMHRLPSPETRLQRALTALQAADAMARRYYRNADDADMADALCAVRTASIGIRLAMKAERP